MERKSLGSPWRLSSQISKHSHKRKQNIHNQRKYRAWYKNSKAIYSAVKDPSSRVLVKQEAVRLGQRQTVKAKT